MADSSKTCASLPSYEDELAECRRIFDAIVKNISHQHPSADTDLLEKAYNKAKELHGKTRRHSGQLYLRHPLAVMETLARLMCKSSVLVAALLHDTMEDCEYTYEEIREDFSYEIAEIVSAVTALRETENSHTKEFDLLTESEKHDILDTLTDAKLLQSKYQREAFLVRFADREHNLATIMACTAEKRRLKIEQTEAFLIPAAKRLGMYYFVVTLSDYCLRYRDTETSYSPLPLICQCRNEYAAVSGQAFSKFDDMMKAAIDSQQFFEFSSYCPLSPARSGKRTDSGDPYMYRRRLLCPYELAQQIAPDLSLSQARLLVFDRQSVCLNEIVLTCKSQDKREILAQFLSLYREKIKPSGIFLKYDSEDDDSVTLLLTDQLENNYRIVLLPSAKLEKRYIGDSNGGTIALVSEDSIADAVRPQITVYTYSKGKGVFKYPQRVPQGATALDFAFIVRPSMAFTAKYAQIKKFQNGQFRPFSDSDYRYPLKTVLNDGDIVHFDADYLETKGEGIKVIKNNVCMEWFAYINTKRAARCLIDYFNGGTTTAHDGASARDDWKIKIPYNELL